MNKILRLLSAVLVLAAASLACGTSTTPTESGGQQISQWAVSATASSEFGNPSWAASQATGAPDTTGCGDMVTAWASAYSYTVEWLELTYATPVYATQVVIHQTYNPSQVVKVELIDTTGGAHVMYTAQPAEQVCPYTLTISSAKTNYKVARVRITVDQSILQGWNEIDAVQLIGYTE